MSKYTGFIVIAAFLLAILVGVFWNEITRVDTITIVVGIIFCLLGLSFFLYTVSRILFYGDHIDWSKPNILFRAFLPPFDSEKPHR